MAKRANGELKIEKGIPIPTLYKSGATTKTLRAMKPGDSVLLPASFDRQYAYSIFGKGNSVSRKMQNGIRVWRIK